MGLPEHWATAEDFATLFQYFWHRDFPIDAAAVGARRADWTIHIGLVVRQIADLMGFVARFESRGRKDAVLRSGDGEEITVEWEWDAKGVCASEVRKLRSHEPRRKDGAPIRFAVLVTYCEPRDVSELRQTIEAAWVGVDWPLLLILVEAQKSKIFSTSRKFALLRMSLFNGTESKELRSVPAFPWKIGASRWEWQRASSA